MMVPGLVGCEVSMVVFWLMVIWVGGVVVDPMVMSCWGVVMVALRRVMVPSEVMVVDPCMFGLCVFGFCVFGLCIVAEMSDCWVEWMVVVGEVMVAWWLRSMVSAVREVVLVAV